MLAFKRTTLVPKGLQNLGEMAVDAVYVNIIDEVMGVRGRRFAPLLVTLFWMILALTSPGSCPCCTCLPRPSSVFRWSSR